MLAPIFDPQANGSVSERTSLFEKGKPKATAPFPSLHHTPPKKQIIPPSFLKTEKRASSRYFHFHLLPKNKTPSELRSKEPGTCRAPRAETSARAPGVREHGAGWRRAAGGRFGHLPPLPGPGHGL